MRPKQDRSFQNLLETVEGKKTCHPTFRDNPQKNFFIVQTLLVLHYLPDRKTLAGARRGLIHSAHDRLYCFSRTLCMFYYQKTNFPKFVPRFFSHYQKALSIGWTEICHILQGHKMRVEMEGTCLTNEEKVKIFICRQLAISTQ